MRVLALAIVGVSAMGCFGKIAPEPSDGGSNVDAGDAGADAPDGRGPAPVPNCTGTTTCLQDGYIITGAVTVTCDPVDFVGPWDLLLERLVTTDYRVVQTQVVDTPGFGATFNDTSAPPVAKLTYRVCTIDDDGTRCGTPFVTLSAPICAKCAPFTCDNLKACNTTVSNGCGGTNECGACPNGAACLARYQSCCPVGFEPDGNGGCECAPPRPCPRRYYWEAAWCKCAPIFRPEPL
jgi:hypothetical protein